MRDFFRPLTLQFQVHDQFEAMLSKHLPKDAASTVTLYDIGCGKKPFAPFLKDKVKAHIGVDLEQGFYETGKVDLVGTAYAVPAPDGAADVIISSQVLEHLEEPLQAMAEAHRLLKSGGLLFASFPFLYPLHAIPHDYMRYTEFYLTNKLAGDKFKIVELQRVAGFWYIMGFNIGLYLQDFDRGPLKKLYIVKALNFLSGALFLSLHTLEGLALKALGKDVAGVRSKWTVNYVAVMQKI